MFWPKLHEVGEGSKRAIMQRTVICALHQIRICWSSQEWWDWGRNVVHMEGWAVEKCIQNCGWKGWRAKLNVKTVLIEIGCDVGYICLAWDRSQAELLWIRQWNSISIKDAEVLDCLSDRQFLKDFFFGDFNLVDCSDHGRRHCRLLVTSGSRVNNWQAQYTRWRTTKRSSTVVLIWCSPILLRAFILYSSFRWRCVRSDDLQIWLMALI
jgi:hypothetical protein